MFSQHRSIRQLLTLNGRYCTTNLRSCTRAGPKSYCLNCRSVTLLRSILQTGNQAIPLWKFLSSLFLNHLSYLESSSDHVSLWLQRHVLCWTRSRRGSQTNDASLRWIHFIHSYESQRRFTGRLRIIWRETNRRRKARWWSKLITASSFFYFAILWFFLQKPVENIKMIFHYSNKSSSNESLSHAGLGKTLFFFQFCQYWHTNFKHLI